MAVVALLCVAPALVGGLLITAGEGGQALGWAMLGFFGAGAVVLGRKAFGAG